MRGSKRNTTILLSLVCVSIWGTIGWKIYCNWADVPVPACRTTFKSAKSKERDSVWLIMNYRDPFLEDEPKELAETEEYNESQQQLMTETPIDTYNPDEIALQSLHYKGSIRNKLGMQAIITSNNEYLLVRVQDKVEDFVVTIITEDELTLSRADNHYHIEKE